MAEFLIDVMSSYLDDDKCDSGLISILQRSASSLNGADFAQYDFFELAFADTIPEVDDPLRLPPVPIEQKKYVIVALRATTNYKQYAGVE